MIPQFDWTYRFFNEGIASVRIGDVTSGKWGYIDKTGKYAINPQFDSAEKLEKGVYMQVFPLEMTRQVNGDTTTSYGGYKINAQFGGAEDFHDGLAEVRIGDVTSGKWGCMDKTGKVVINPQFEATNSFSDGLAEVRIGDVTSGKWGYMDKTGKVVIDPQFSGGDFQLSDTGN